MSTLAIVGGTGLTSLQDLTIIRKEVVRTPYGETSAPLTHGRLKEREVVFLPRHGSRHNIPPHKINYRANLWALKHIGARQVVAVAAVGGIDEALIPASLAVPDQIIDYTWGRKHTLFESDLSRVTHVDFTYPYCAPLRDLLLSAAAAAGYPTASSGTYAATQGPRLETAKEIDRLERDGCDMVGMTGMPEAALAREIGLCYACLAVVANRAAGRGEGEISMEAIEAQLTVGMEKIRAVLHRLVELL